MIFWFSFKGIGIIDASPETCYKYCDPKPDGKRVKWDRAIKELEVIEYLRKDDPVSAKVSTVIVRHWKEMLVAKVIQETVKLN